MQVITKKQCLQFQQTIRTYYQQHKRNFAWRVTNNPYHILVSEIMLQQTQTDRVVPKYDAFLAQFPTVNALAHAPLYAVLTAWQGLGYNRRAKALHAAAKKIVQELGSSIPSCPEILKTLPGVGPYTAGAICAFAFEKPVVFIETNIRTVYIHFFFQNKPVVHDKELFPLIEITLFKSEIRNWYYALMDYGVMLKKQLPNPNRKSIHYTKQSKFEGSDRQIRGHI